MLSWKHCILGLTVNKRPEMPVSSGHLLSVASVVVFVGFALILTLQLAWTVQERHVVSPSNPQLAFRAPKANIWAELTDIEAAEICNFLIDGSNDLNLTRNPVGKDWHNQIGRKNP